MKTRLTPPNLLTLSRVLIVPFFIFCFYLKVEYRFYICTILFFYASITDYIDGFLARKYAWVSTFGAFIDPVADKLVVVTAFLMLLTQFKQAFIVIPIVCIILRELLVSALREWLASLGKREVVAVSFTAKLKTSVQMLAIILLLLTLQIPTSVLLFSFALVCLYLSTCLTLMSLLRYLHSAWPYLWYKKNE